MDIFTFLQQLQDQFQDLVINENVLLQTLGFDVAIDHPHTHVVRCCQLVKGKTDCYIIYYINYYNISIQYFIY